MAGIMLARHPRVQLIAKEKAVELALRITLFQWILAGRRSRASWLFPLNERVHRASWTGSRKMMIYYHLN